MKKRAIIAMLLLSVMFFNGTASIEVHAHEGTNSVILADDQNKITYTNGDISTIASESEVLGETDYFRYYDDKGNPVIFTLTFRAQTGLIFTPNGTDASDFTLTGNNYYTLTFLDELPEGYKR